MTSSDNELEVTEQSPSTDIPMFTKWSMLQIILVLGALGVMVWKLAFGLGAVTNLNDDWPWGLWVSFDLLGGVALAAGGFTVAAIVYIFHLEKYRSVVKPAILTAFLGYILVTIGIAFDIGRTPRLVHSIWMWQPNSVLFEVGICVMLYTTVLAMEFGHNVMERFRLKKLLNMFRFIMIPLIILGITLSFFHQSSLGALFLVVPHKLDSLWYTSQIGWTFFISAVALGLVMVIFETIISSRVFKKSLRMDVLSGLGRAAAWVMALYLALRFYDLITTGSLATFSFNILGWLFLVEVILGMFLPMILLWIGKVRKSPAGLLTASSLIVAGLVLNRLNTSLIGFTLTREGSYFPSLTEFIFSIGLIAGALLVFRLAVKYLPVFSEHHAGLPEALEGGSAQVDIVRA